MSEIVTFIAAVVLTGWALGYFLANEMKGKTSPSPKALVYSLLAVGMPTIMAFVLSRDHAGSLLRQFRPEHFSHFFALAVLFPALIAMAGHLGGVSKAKDKSLLIPTGEALAQGLQMIALLIVWGLLEEIGWRGYLLPKLIDLGMTTLVASLLIGLFWGLWHAPQMFFNEQLKKSFHGRIGLGLSLWSTQCLLLGGILGWLQHASGSFLFPAIAHALVNLFGNISDATLGEKRNCLWAGTSGAWACLCSLLLLVVLFLI